MNDQDKPGKDEATPPEAANDESGRRFDRATDATLEALQEALGGAHADEPRIAELEGQVADLTDRLLRTAAESDNIRRRTEKEKDDTRKYAVQKFAEDMLAVADNLARALESIPAEARENEQVRALAEGVALTGRELAGVLERHGVRPIDARGRRFDPNLHQAVYEVPTDEAEPGTVVQVLRDGYTISDRLLRAAMVGVAKAKD